MTTYRVWYMYEFEDVTDADTARRLADEALVSSDPMDEPTVAYVEEVDQ